MNLLYTRASCLQMIDTLRHLKQDNSQRFSELQELQDTTHRNLELIRRLEGLIDFCEEIIAERLKEIEETQ